MYVFNFLSCYFYWTGISQAMHTPPTPQTTPSSDPSPAPTEQRSKVVREAVTSGSEGESSRVRVMEPASRRHRPVLRSSVSVPNQTELELGFEREAMCQLNLDQRSDQPSLAEKGHLLRLLNVIGIRSPASSQISPAQASPAPLTGLSGPETGFVSKDECSDLVPTGSHPSLPSVTLNGVPPKGSNLGSKELARMQLTRVIEQKQQQHKQQQKPQQSQQLQQQQEAKATGVHVRAPPLMPPKSKGAKSSKTTDDLIRSPRSSSSPTPSLTNLVPFGLASQGRRKRERAATEGGLDTDSDGRKSENVKQAKKPLLPLGKGRKSRATSSSMEVVREASQEDASPTSVAAANQEKTEEISERNEVRINLSSDVECADGDGDVGTADSETVQENDARNTVQGTRKESEFDDVFSEERGDHHHQSVATTTDSRDHSVATTTDSDSTRHPTSPTKAKSDSNILCLSPEETEGNFKLAGTVAVAVSAAGVAKKKIALKSDHSWIRRKKSLEVEEEDNSRKVVSPPQPPSSTNSSPPIPYRSHAILPTKVPSSSNPILPTSTSLSDTQRPAARRPSPTTVVLAAPNRAHSPKVPNRAHHSHSPSPSPPNAKKGERKTGGKVKGRGGGKERRFVGQSSSEENLNRIVSRDEKVHVRICVSEMKYAAKCANLLCIYMYFGICTYI